MTGHNLQCGLMELFLKSLISRSFGLEKFSDTHPPRPLDRGVCGGCFLRWWGLCGTIYRPHFTILAEVVGELQQHALGDSERCQLDRAQDITSGQKVRSAFHHVAALFQFSLGCQLLCSLLWKSLDSLVFSPISRVKQLLFFLVLPTRSCVPSRP